MIDEWPIQKYPGKKKCGCAPDKRSAGKTLRFGTKFENIFCDIYECSEVLLCCSFLLIFARTLLVNAARKMAARTGLVGANFGCSLGLLSSLCFVMAAITKGNYFKNNSVVPTIYFCGYF